MRYIDFKLKAVKLFEAAGINDAAVDAEYLMLHVTGMSRSRLFAEQMEEMAGEDVKKLNELVERRLKHEPLQYILGTQEFMGFEFKCTPAVLIPRQDTEVLVEKALEKVPGVLQNKMKLDGENPECTSFGNAKSLGAGVLFLDICTGSGCIPISFKKHAEEKYHCSVNCSASDISSEALEVARENAERLGTEVHFIESDMWTNIVGKYDIITSNPPYIETEIIKGLMPEVSEYEPRLALDGGDDGLIFYRILVDNAAGRLNENGWLIMEIGDTQGEAVSGLLMAAGFRNVKVIKDYAGLDRVVEGQL